MLCLCGFELYSRWVPLLTVQHTLNIGRRTVLTLENILPLDLHKTVSIVSRLLMKKS